ncbi:MAG: PIN domain-containing protein [Candidatus Rokubacteria bacterium]|nr:PIN domain-containing protein [Candidatus Rokubacteria bacterium]
MRLVDSSAWVHCLRRGGDPKVIDHVRRLVESGDAAWCSPVRLELWNGVGNDGDRRVLREFEQTLPELPITDAVWTEACALADRCRKAGKTAPAIDVLIAACARHHGVELEHADRHFDFLMTL